ncbi:MAG: TIGR02996 domain-containing protein [Gemmataceae bacterium]
MLNDEAQFLRAIEADREDHVLLVYADWLEEQGDRRAEFIRLVCLLRNIDPDDVQRPAAEERLSKLRKQCDAAWVAIVDPASSWRQPYTACPCPLESGSEEYGPFSEMRLHREAQDTECPNWKRLLRLIEDASADGRPELVPFMSESENLYEERPWEGVITLPPSIAKLKAVNHLGLYGSELMRIPPEIGEMDSLESFDPYTSYFLHWLPYEITRCKNLKHSRLSTRALYGNFKYRPPFPVLEPRKSVPAGAVRKCSVCDRPFHDVGEHRVWISLRVATDVLPLLVNACSQNCIDRLPAPPENYVPYPHRGGLDVQQPAARYL